MESVADYLVSQSKGTLGTSLFCYMWGGGVVDGILINSTGGNTPDRFIDCDNSRINYTFINILVRNDDMGTGLDNAESILSLFEKNTISGFISNKPRRDEVIFVGPEKTSLGTIYYFGIDILVKSVKSNN